MPEHEPDVTRCRGDLDSGQQHPAPPDLLEYGCGISDSRSPRILRKYVVQEKFLPEIGVEQQLGQLAYGLQNVAACYGLQHAGWIGVDDSANEGLDDLVSSCIGNRRLGVQRLVDCWHDDFDYQALEGCLNHPPALFLRVIGTVVDPSRANRQNAIERCLGVGRHQRCRLRRRHHPLPSHVP